MSLLRNALLWISENRTLRQSLPKYKFIRHAVSRFMPGEELGDALNAAEQLEKRSISSILTHLGENIIDGHEAANVAQHYLWMLQLTHKQKLDAYVSVKLTQLGLDVDENDCLSNLTAIVRTAQTVGTMVWIDIEQSHYVDRTISMFKNIRQQYANVGLCLQAYLYRTENDLRELLPLSPAIRLVKGAYKEPPSVAFPNKSDVDENYFRLAEIMLANVKENGVYAGIATHDVVLHKQIIHKAEQLGLSRQAYEFQMLYGIKMDVQYKLASEGYRVRNLISFGKFWFPWYMRRLAERPANVWFVVKNIFS